VIYYPRILGLKSFLSWKPYIVSSRKSEDLIENLLKDGYPILFEGLHSCYYLDDPRLAGRFKIYRESNIEHRYYFNLFMVDTNLRNKLYFFGASAKLRLYQKVLHHANLMLAVSQHDADYLHHHFPGIQVYHLPSFHANDHVSIQPGAGDYALYHGNIEVPENEYAATYLVNKVFHDLDIPFIIAGMNPRPKFRKLLDGKANIMLIANPAEEKMSDLIRNAHVHILVTFQATGLKLKLLNTLYNGRFCIVNEAMLKGTELGPMCEIANSTEEIRNRLKEIFKREFTVEESERRQEILRKKYDNYVNAEKMISLIYNP
jgi:hypothetical protein